MPPKFTNPPPPNDKGEVRVIVNMGGGSGGSGEDKLGVYVEIDGFDGFDGLNV